MNPALPFSNFVVLCALFCSIGTAFAQDVDKSIIDAESKRIAAIAKVQPAVVAVFARGGGGGGSGVLISKDGYALTNFHVVQPTGPVMQCGLADGVLYDAVLVGLDPVGDVALIKLLPKEANKDFPFVALGDSDQTRVGEWALAMGNPFLLATDFTPTITFGLVSGTNRYQYPAGTILEYTDCIQVDTSINPGNSGGPLFNLNGELIGINGRGSFEKRGRINSGVGYAISINQIKNFLGHLRGGLVVDHATLGAIAKTDDEGHMVVTQILSDSDTYRRGVTEGDELEAFAGRTLRSINQYKNVLGIYPRGWRLPLTYRHIDEEKKETTRRETLVRLSGALPKEIDPTKGNTDPDRPRPGQPPRPGEPPRPGAPRPGERPMPTAPPADSPATKLYEAKTGFANHYFNKLERDRLFTAFKKHGDFTKMNGVWKFDADMIRPEKNKTSAEISDKIATLAVGGLVFKVEPLKADLTDEAVAIPPNSGGFGMALYQWRRLLELGEMGFEAGWTYGGYEPFYPDGTPSSRVDAEVLSTEHSAVTCKWFFSQKDQTLLGFECWIKKDGDPCEVFLSDYKDVDGRKLPHRMEVRHSDKEFGLFTLKSYQLAAAPAKAEEKKENK